MSRTELPTETPAGRAWAEKYLHPPSVKRNGYIATPDNNMCPVATLELDSIANISPIFTISSVQYYSTDLLFLQGSGARVVAYVFVRTPAIMSGNWILHPQTPAVVFDQYDFDGSWGSDVSLQRLGYKSCTYYLNATQFNDQGTVTVAQFRPNIFTSTQTLPTDPTCSTPFEIQKRISSTADYNSQIIDLGRIDGGGFTGAYVPSTTTMVQQSSPKAVSHMAREGAFVPQHWSQPINLFYNQPDGQNGSEFDMVQTYIRFIQADHSEHLLPLFNSPPSTPPTLAQMSDTVWSDFSWAYVFFAGLSVPTGESMANAPYITVKSYLGVEVQPSIKSSFVFFQTPAPIPDDRAIHVAAGLVHQKPDGFPSSANDFGSIIALAASFVPRAITWVKNLFSSPKATIRKEAVAVTKTLAKEVMTPNSRVSRALTRVDRPRSASTQPRPRQRNQSKQRTRVFEKSNSSNRKSRFDSVVLPPNATQRAEERRRLLATTKQLQNTRVSNNGLMRSFPNQPQGNNMFRGRFSNRL